MPKAKRVRWATIKPKDTTSPYLRSPPPQTKASVTSPRIQTAKHIKAMEFAIFDDYRGEALLTAPLSSEFSDLTLVLEDAEVRVHKIIVCTISPYIRALVEKSEDPAVLDLSEEKIDPFLPFLHYMYTGSYAAEIELDIRIFSIATHYEVPALADLAREHFKQAIQELDITVKGEKFQRIIYAVYNSVANFAAHPFKEPVVLTILANLTSIMKEDRGEWLETLSIRIPGLWSDYMNKIIETGVVEQSQAPLVLCDNCGPAEQKYDFKTECRTCGSEVSCSAN